MALWDHVQSTSADPGAGTTITLPYTGAVVAGNLLTASCRVGGIGANPALSDDVNGAWTRLFAIDVNGDHTFAIFYKLNTGAGTPIVTLTNTSGTRRWAIHEYSAASQTIAFDQQVSTTGSGTAGDSGNIVTSASALLFGALSNQDGVVVTAGTGYTIRQSVSQKLDTEDKSGAAGTYSASFTLGTSTAWGAGLATFVVSVGGGGRTTKNTRSAPLGVEIGMNWRGNMAPATAPRRIWAMQQGLYRPVADRFDVQVAA